MKRKTLSGLAALTLFDIAAAHAQTPAQLAFAGTYVGAFAGYRWADLDASVPIGGFPIVTEGAGGNPSALPAQPCFLCAPGTAVFPLIGQTPNLHPNGGVFGLLAGQNFIVQSPFLIGWEADVTWGKKTSTTGIASSTSISVPAFFGTVPFSVAGAGSFSATVDWSASLRARLGYLIDSWLIYGTFGGSLQRVTLSGVFGYTGAGSACGFFDGFCLFTNNFATSSASSFSLTKTLVGAVVGTGIERLIGTNLTLRIEYLAAFYGRVDFGNVVVNSSYSDNFLCNCTVNSSVLGNVSANVTTQTLRIALTTKLP